MTNEAIHRLEISCRKNSGSSSNQISSEDRRTREGLRRCQANDHAQAEAAELGAQAGHNGSLIRQERRILERITDCEETVELDQED